MAESVRDIPEEMVEKAALAMHDQSCTCDGSERCRKSAVWPRGVLIAEAREILSAALEGCAVVQLPDPEMALNDTPGLRAHTVFDVDSFRGGPLLWAEEAERRGAALIAAAREARRLASGSWGG